MAGIVRLILLLLSIVMAGGATRAAETPPRSLDELGDALAAAFAETKIAGMAYVVVENGDIVLTGVAGKADLETGAPVTRETLFRWGSASKNLTALMLQRLAERGEIDLERPVRDLDPEIAIDNPWEADHPVRLVNLIEHTAGLAGSTYAEYASDGADTTPGDYVRLMQGHLAARWRPGLFFAYANSGPTLAAAVAERVTGVAFDDLMAREVLRPLGMASTTFRLGATPPARLSRSYGGDGVTLQPTWRMSIRPSGAALGTIDDMGKLVRFYAREGLADDGSRLLAPESVRRMRVGTTSIMARHGFRVGDYGLGTFGFALDGQLFYGHWGKLEGFLAMFGVLPDSGRGFALLVNTADGAGRFRLARLIGAYLTRDLPPPAPPPVAAIEPARYAGYYQNITHDMAMRAWIWETLGLVRVAPEGEGLSVAPLLPINRVQTLVPIDADQFRSPDSWIPAAAFIEEDGVLWYIGDERAAFRPVSAAYAWLHVGTAVLAAALGALGAVVALVLLGGRAAGFMKHRKGWATALLAALAALALLALVGLYVRAGLFGDWRTLGQLGVVGGLSLLLAALSIVSVLCLAWAAWRLFSAWPAHGWASRGYVLLTLLVLGISWTYLAGFGWLPLLSWRLS